MAKKKYVMVRISRDPTWKRIQAEKLIRDSNSIDEALKELFIEFDNSKKKDRIEDIFHL